MYFEFSNMKFYIDGCKLNTNRAESEFLRTEEVQVDDQGLSVAAMVSLVDSITIGEGRLVYRDYTGTLVFQNGNEECRVFLHYETGQPFAKTTSNGTGTISIELLKTLFAENSPSEMFLFNLLAAEKFLHENNRVILHSSYIALDKEKGAILFTAPSGTGKSTQAELWHKYRGAQVINGDRSIIWKENGTWYAGGLPWCGTSGISKNRILPLKAIVMLDQALVNEISEIPYALKLRRMLEQTTINPWNKEMKAHVQSLLMELCAEVPIWHLACRPDSGAVEALEAVIER